MDLGPWFIQGTSDSGWNFIEQVQKKLFEEENIDRDQDKHGDAPWALGFECFLEPINLDFGKDIEVDYRQ